MTSRELTAQAHANACARTRLNMAIHQLEVCRGHLEAAGMKRECRTLDRWLREQTGVLGSWLPPLRDRVGRAS